MWWVCKKFHIVYTIPIILTKEIKFFFYAILTKKKSKKLQNIVEANNKSTSTNKRTNLFQTNKQFLLRRTKFTLNRNHLLSIL